MGAGMLAKAVQFTPLAHKAQELFRRSARAGETVDAFELASPAEVEHLAANFARWKRNITLGSRSGSSSRSGCHRVADAAGYLKLVRFPHLPTVVQFITRDPFAHLQLLPPTPQEAAE